MTAAFLRIARYPGGSAALAVATFALYWAVFDWRIALVTVLATYLHELGHALAARHVGVPVGGIIIHPFGATTLTAHIADQWHAVYVTAMGPSFSLLNAGLFWTVYQGTGALFWVAAALAVILVNLLNLLPLPARIGTDGARLVDMVFHDGSWRWSVPIESGKLLLARCWYIGLIVIHIAAVHGLALLIAGEIGGAP